MALEKGFPPELQRNHNGYVSGLFVRPSLAENPTHPLSLRQENIVKVWLPFLANNRTSIVRTKPSQETYLDSLGGRLGAPYDDTFFLDDTTVIPQAQQEDIPKVKELPARGNVLTIVLPIPTSQVEVHQHINDIVFLGCEFVPQAAETDGRVPCVFAKGGPRLDVYGTNITRKNDTAIPAGTAAKLKKMGLESTGAGKKVGRTELMNLKLRISSASSVWKKTRKPAGKKVRKFQQHDMRYDKVREQGLT
ncbi:unnamed protein product [Symbiodinium sp. CCMP2592]|nr:unnamed protein product [Symbiodinium sp. CCMP2592]